MKYRLVHLMPTLAEKKIKGGSNPFSNFTKLSPRGKTSSLMPVLEESMFWKSSNFTNEMLCMPEHAPSLPYQHMVKFSPPSDLINTVYKFLGMPPSVKSTKPTTNILIMALIWLEIFSEY